MTPERERAIRESLRLRFSRTDADLLAEIDRLRALPVLRTCGDCRRATMLGQKRDARGYPRYACTHDDVLGRDTQSRDVSDSVLSMTIPVAPPTWCPLRGGGR